jgi:hypothetical protein
LFNSLARFRKVGHRITGNRQQGRSYGVGYDKVYVAVDDATRLGYIEVLADEQKPTVIVFLSRAVAWFNGQGIAATVPTPAPPVLPPVATRKAVAVMPPVVPSFPPPPSAADLRRPHPSPHRSGLGIIRRCGPSCCLSPHDLLFAGVSAACAGLQLIRTN